MTGYSGEGDAIKWAALLNSLAPDIVVRSPITDRIRFEGIEEVRHLFAAVADVVEDIRFYRIEDAGADHRVLFWRGRVGGHYLEEANLVRLNAEGQIAEMTVFMRPVPGLLELVSRLAGRLARRHGRFRALLARCLTAPLGFAFRSLEPVAVWLVGAGVRQPRR
jgi:hypothetical protein